MAERTRTFAAHVLFVLAVGGALEWAARAGLLDPSFFGQPSGVLAFLAEHVRGVVFWRDLLWSLGATLIAFLSGSAAAIVVGLLFVMLPPLERFLSPYFGALNVMPRIALAPLFLLWFGIGIGSKVAVGCSLTFFIVLSSAVAGIRGISQDHVTLCRTLGARPAAVFFRVTLPGAVPVLFSGLRLGLIAAMLGVIGAEIIAAEHGLGQRLAYLGSTFHINGVMGLLLVMAIVGASILRGMDWLEARLLRWQ
jgi:NitT/TauT family transport system permease protein